MKKRRPSPGRLLDALRHLKVGQDACLFYVVPEFAFEAFTAPAVKLDNLDANDKRLLESVKQVVLQMDDSVRAKFVQLEEAVNEELKELKEDMQVEDPATHEPSQ